MKLLLLIFGLVSSSGMAFAQTVFPSRDAEISGIVSELILKVIKPTVSLLAPAQRQIISRVEIRLTDGFNVQGPQATMMQDGTPVIYIPSIYITLQREYVWSVLIGTLIDDENFPEYWVTHALFRLSPDFNMSRGGIPLSPQTYSGLSQTEIDNISTVYHQQITAVFAATILDILFHEISHFLVEDGVFDWTQTTATKAAQIEQSADNFSSYLFNVYLTSIVNEVDGDDPFNLIGRIHSAGLVDEIRNFLKTSGVTHTIRYPSFTDRIERPLNSAGCAKTEPSYTCFVASERTKVSINRQEFVSHYQERVERGEKFAVYRLSRYFMQGGQSERGCGYLRNDDTGYAVLAGEKSLLWAQCLDASLIWQDKSRGERLNQAARYYCDAWKVGFESYQSYLDIVSYLNWPDFCKNE